SRSARTAERASAAHPASVPSWPRTYPTVLGRAHTGPGSVAPMSPEHPHERVHERVHEPTAAELAEDAESLDRPVPWWGFVGLVAFVALVVCGYIATGVAPTWATSNPEGLLALNARIRHLLLAIGGGIGW